MKPIAYLNLAADYACYKEQWLKAVDESGTQGRFILGEHCEAFEAEFAAYIGAPYAIGLANGTDALLFALIAAGIKEGDEVITTPWTFYASSEAITHLRAKPVFVDIEPQSFTMDLNLIESHISAKTRAIMAVHIFGCTMPLAPLRQLADRHQIALIEDCAQSCGGSYDGNMGGSVGDFGCFSFYPTKVLNAWGDGGMVVCQREQDYQRILHLRNHAAVAPFVHDDLGHNSRLDEIQAALLRCKLQDMEQSVSARREAAAAYERRLGSCSQLQVPRDLALGKHAYNLYTLITPKRDRVVQALKAQHIGHSICYPQPLHLQPVYAQTHQNVSLPQAERLAHEVVSLPIHPYMSHADIDQISEIILAALK